MPFINDIVSCLTFDFSFHCYVQFIPHPLIYKLILRSFSLLCMQWRIQFLHFCFLSNDIWLIYIYILILKYVHFRSPSPSIPSICISLSLPPSFYYSRFFFLFHDFMVIFFFFFFSHFSIYLLELRYWAPFGMVSTTGKFDW